MRRKIVIFVGPSLPTEEARQILDAEYRPPAARGDIAAAAADGARVIGLIDGVFFQDCSVGHREIVGVIESGVRVLGSSSMGALRAAELDSLGMEGVGEIYRRYRDGELVSDDEVALTFDPVEYRPISEPLVNIRETVRAASESGLIGPGTASVLVTCASSLYFPDRTYKRIRDCAARSGGDPDECDRFLESAREHPLDLKRRDAILLLELIRDSSPDS
jgi:hypothetical protein